MIAWAVDLIADGKSGVEKTSEVKAESQREAARRFGHSAFPSWPVGRYALVRAPTSRRGRMYKFAPAGDLIRIF